MKYIDILTFLRKHSMSQMKWNREWNGQGIYSTAKVTGSLISCNFALMWLGTIMRESWKISHHFLTCKRHFQWNTYIFSQCVCWSIVHSCNSYMVDNYVLTQSNSIRFDRSLQYSPTHLLETLYYTLGVFALNQVLTWYKCNVGRSTQRKYW